MTVATDKTVDTPLSANDYLVGDGDSGPDLSQYALPWSMGVNAHVRAETPILVRLYEQEDRITVRVGEYPAYLHLFLRADQVDRLITLLTAARKRLP